MAPAEHALVLPSPAQLAAARAVQDSCGVALTAIVDPELAAVAGDLTVVPADQATGRAAPSNARAMCCHERGVYWVAAYRPAVGALNFADRCLHMLSKLELAAALIEAGVRPTPKTPLPAGVEPAPERYPLVVKPNFGFASALVKRIPNATALHLYRQGFAELHRRSLLADYADFADRHAGTDPTLIVVEPDLSASTVFLTVPFLVHRGAVVGRYPVGGLSQRADPLTDFHWTGFHTLPPPDGVLPLLDAMLARLAAAFELTGGVYEVEALYDPHGPVLYCLEFSPRVTGGAIPELVRLASGVDLHDLGLRYFLGLDAPLPPVAPARPLVLRNRLASDPPANGAQILHTQARRLGGTEYVDEIFMAPQGATAP